MVYKAPVDTLLSIGGRNLTGMGMLLSITEQPLSAKTEDVDLIGVPYVYSVKTGKKGFGFSIGGYVRDDEGSILKLHGMPNGSVIYARYGNKPGAHVDIIPEVLTRGGDFTLPKDGLIKVNNVQYELAKASGVLIDGALIANQLVIDDLSLIHI